MMQFDPAHIAEYWRRLPLLINRRLQWLALAVLMLLLVSAAFHAGSQNLLVQGRNAGKMIAIYQLLESDIASNKTKPVSAKPVALKPDNAAVISTAAVMTRVRSLAKQQSLSIREISTDMRQEQGGNWLMVNLEAQGSYRHVKTLLAELQQHYPQLRFDSLKIEKAKRGQLLLWLKFAPGQVGA